MSQDKHFTLFTNVPAPNGWKITFVLNTLGLTYESRYLEMEEIKYPEHVSYNPNGRIPTLIDHKNDNLVIWESGAILLYLVEKYDTEHKISVSSPNDKAILTQWLFFQSSGQGPYFGQALWYNFRHSEKIPSVIVRYHDEAKRVLGVLESVLSKQDWLVGGKLTIADIAFVPYNSILKGVVLPEDFNFEKEFPLTYAWHSRVIASPGVKEGLAERQRLADEAAEKAKAA